MLKLSFISKNTRETDNTLEKSTKILYDAYIGSPGASLSCLRGYKSNMAPGTVKRAIGTKGHVRYINIQAWLRGFRVKIANFSSFFCPSIPKRDLDTKKTTPNMEVCPESLGAMLEY